MKRPSFQFYPGDWLNDAALRTCSVSARGLWIDAMCFMHQGSEYGYLKVNHKVITKDILARLVGCSNDDAKTWLDELYYAGVYSIDDNGCIFSRRMVNDEKLRKTRAEGGKLGGNPMLKGLGIKVDDKVNQKPTPSSSSSSSSSITPLPPKGGKTPAITETQAAEIYAAYPLKVGKPKAIQAIMRSGVKAGWERLLERTKAYAIARAGNLPYTPHPSTWFNQERYNDDPATWVKNEQNSFIKPHDNNGPY